jgi:uroporphyrinogen-III synthase
MRVIVTRPQRDAQGWVQALSAAGLDVLALPLIDISPVPDPARVQAAWRRLGDYLGVMFVSGNAVEAFFAARPPDAQAMGSTRAWATGPGTRAALLRAGVEAACIDAPAPDAAQFDSEALWQVVAGQVRPGDRVLIVRGTDGQAEGAEQGVGRNWFARRLQEAGAVVDMVISYQRERPRFSPEQLQLARAAATDGAVWLFSSSEAVANLQACLPGQDWGAARALTTHGRIAEAARAAGFGVVREARPALADILASLESAG